MNHELTACVVRASQAVSADARTAIEDIKIESNAQIKGSPKPLGDFEQTCIAANGP